MWAPGEHCQRPVTRQVWQFKKKRLGALLTRTPNQRLQQRFDINTVTESVNVGVNKAPNHVPNAGGVTA